MLGGGIGCNRECRWVRPGRTYPKLLGTGRSRLVVLGLGTGGRWSQQCVPLTWTSRWAVLLAEATMLFFASSLLTLPASAATNVDRPCRCAPYRPNQHASSCKAGRPPGSSSSGTWSRSRREAKFCKSRFTGARKGTGLVSCCSWAAS